MKRHQVWAAAVLTLLAYGCSGSTKPPENPVTTTTGPGSVDPGAETPRICADDPVDEDAPPPPAAEPGAAPCPPIKEATPEECAAQNHFFIERTKLCAQECGPQFTVEGKVCKGDGPGGSVSCHAPTPYRRCTGGNYCFCSST